jgi:hypothetical protein
LTVSVSTAVVGAGDDIADFTSVTLEALALALGAFPVIAAVILATLLATVDALELGEALADTIFTCSMECALARARSLRAVFAIPTKTTSAESVNAGPIVVAVIRTEGNIAA